MNYRMIRYLLGVILLIEAVFMIFPSLVALIYGESVFPFALTIGILLLVSLPFTLFKPKDTKIYAKEGFITVAAGWILLSAFGALPFVFSGVIPNFIDALFETVSGFTTTGASILNEIESLPKGILFWRSFTHWIGGMGVLVFMLAILPSAGGETIHLMRAEVPGPTKGKLVPKMRQTALILYGTYIALTLIQVIALLLCRFPLFDAFVTSFATAGTGGFSILNASIAGYQNPAAEWVIAIFMLLFGINFNLFFFVIVGKIKDVFKSEELRAYLCVILAAVGVILVNAYQYFDSFWQGLRTVFFQVSSIITTTGFCTVEFNEWPVLSKTVIVLLMMIGACAGSTGGGIKCARVILIIKGVRRNLAQMLRPHKVQVIRFNDKPMDERLIANTNAYLCAYSLILIVSFLLVSVDNFSLVTNFSAVVACFNNIGPGFDMVGPAYNYADYSFFSKIVLILDMLAGRLEIFPILALFSLKTWTPTR